MNERCNEESRGYDREFGDLLDGRLLQRVDQKKARENETKDKDLGGEEPVCDMDHIYLSASFG